MTVNDLIKLLQTFPPDLQVAYEIYSEQCLLDIDDVRVKNLCEPRPDGWVENERPDRPTMKYLVFRGN